MLEYCSREDCTNKNCLYNRKYNGLKGLLKLLAQKKDMAWFNCGYKVGNRFPAVRRSERDAKQKRTPKQKKEANSDHTEYAVATIIKRSGGNL